MKETLTILAIAFFFMSCAPASKHKQLEKISKTGKEMFDAGYSSEALPYAEKALEFSIHEFGEMSKETAGVSQQLAFIFYEKRMFGSSRKEYSRLVRILSTIPGADKKNLIEAYQKLASISLAFEDIKGALQLYKLLHNLQKKFISDTHEDTIDSAFMIVRIQAYLKNHQALYKDIDRLVALVEKKEGGSAYKTKEYLDIKLNFMREEKNFEGELKTLTKMISMLTDTKGKDSIEVADALNQRANTYMVMEQFKEALIDAQTALKINLAKRTKSDPQLIITYQKLATILRHLQDLPDSEEMLLKAKALAKVGDLNQDLFEQSLEMLSGYYLSTENFKKAEKELIELLMLHKKELGESHPNLIFDYNTLADCYSSMNQYVKAQAILEESLQLVSQSYGDTSIHAVNQINRMAMLSYKAEKFPQAITKCEETLELLNTVYPDNHPTYMPIYKSLVLIYKTKKNFNMAAQFSTKALKVSEFTHGNKSPAILQELGELVDIYRLQNLPKKAITFAQRSISILEAQKDGDKFSLAEKLNELGSLYESSGNKGKAKELFDRSRKLYANPETP